MRWIEWGKRGEGGENGGKTLDCSECEKQCYQRDLQCHAGCVVRGRALRLRVSEELAADSTPCLRKAGQL